MGKGESNNSKSWTSTNAGRRLSSFRLTLAGKRFGRQDLIAFDRAVRPDEVYHEPGRKRLTQLTTDERAGRQFLDRRGLDRFHRLHQRRGQGPELVRKFTS